MSSPRSLLHRLEFPDDRESRDLPGDPEQLVDAICQHLHLMFNTRQGNALTVPDFGTSDFSDVTRGYEEATKVQDELRRSIERYEPRLRDVRVDFNQDHDDKFSLHFDIYATVDSGDQERRTAFRSTIENTGEVKVRRR